MIYKRVKSALELPYGSRFRTKVWDDCVFIRVKPYIFKNIDRSSIRRFPVILNTNIVAVCMQTDLQHYTDAELKDYGISANIIRFSGKIEEILKHLSIEQNRLDSSDLEVEIL